MKINPCVYTRDAFRDAVAGEGVAQVLPKAVPIELLFDPKVMLFFDICKFNGPVLKEHPQHPDKIGGWGRTVGSGFRVIC